MLLKRSLMIALALGATCASTAADAQARTLRRADAHLASLSKATSDGATPTGAKLEPSCCAPEPTCCKEPCVTYRHRGPKLCCDSCKPSTPLTLKVKNPCTGCETDVEVCLPACCEGEPKVCEGTGFLCRDTVVYEWCCGYSVRVAFKHCGDLLVTTWGR
jgi:hypothetical protein